MNFQILQEQNLYIITHLLHSHVHTYSKYNTLLWKFIRTVILESLFNFQNLVAIKPENSPDIITSELAQYMWLAFHEILPYNILVISRKVDIRSVAILWM